MFFRPSLFSSPNPWHLITMSVIVLRSSGVFAMRGLSLGVGVGIAFMFI